MPISAVVAGHTHRPDDGSFEGVPIVQPASHGQAIVTIDLHKERSARASKQIYICERKQRPGRRCSSRRGENVLETPEAQRIVEEVKAIVNPYRAVLEEGEFGRSVELELDSEEFKAGCFGDNTCPLGHMVADMLRSYFDSDLAVVNNGTLRATLPRSERIMFESVYNVLPFGSRLARLTLTGKQIKRLIAIGANGEEKGEHYSWSGLMASVDGDRVEAKIDTNRGPREIDDRRTYTVVTTAFLADGGSGFSRLEGPLERSPDWPGEDIFMREVVFKMLQRRGSGTLAVAEFSDDRVTATRRRRH